MECVEVEKNHGIDVYKESWEQLTRDKAFALGEELPEEVCFGFGFD